jgi:hypothetical protein
MSELNDLLGSEDEEEFVDEEKIEQAPLKTNKMEIQSNNVDSYLGSEDEDEMDIDNFVAPAKRNELDKIFGQVSAEQDTKSKRKIRSQLKLPNPYKIDSSLDTIFVRTPNFVKIQTKPFNAKEYEMDEEKKEFDNVTSVMRYRISLNNPSEMESNTRLVRWSDGSQQLIVGEAVFDLKVVPTENW